MRIGHRLGIGFGSILFMSTLCAGYALYQARSSALAMRQMMDRPLAKERVISDFFGLVDSAISRTSMIARSTDSSLSVTFSDVLDDNARRASIVIKQIGTLVDTDEERTTYKQTLELRSIYRDARERIFSMRQKGDAEGALQFYNAKFAPAAQLYLSKIKELLSEQRRAIDLTALQIDHANTLSTNWFLAMESLVLTFGIWAAWIISRGITRPLNRALGIANTVAKGDLTTRFDDEVKRYDELGDLMGALEAMNSSLQRVVSEIQAGTKAITIASQEIADGNHDLSSRTERQASSLGNPPTKRERSEVEFST